MPERLPDFLGLGTQKGGTTTLHQLLTHHPGVHLPACKEVHYFSKHWHHSKRWYSDHFNESRPDQCCPNKVNAADTVSVAEVGMPVLVAGGVGVCFGERCAVHSLPSQ